MADVADRQMALPKQSAAQDEQRPMHRWEALEFRLTLYTTYWLFLFGAILMRLTGQRPRILIGPDGDIKPRRSVFGEAWEMATASIAFAFSSR